MKYEALYRLTLSEGGATVRLKDYPEQILMPVKGYAVAVGTEGITLLEPKPEFVMDPDFTEAFDNVIEKALTYFPSIGAEYLGTWVNDGKIYIDPVFVFASKDVAIGFALRGGELAIYDLAKQREISVRSRKGK